MTKTKSIQVWSCPCVSMILNVSRTGTLKHWMERKLCTPPKIVIRL